VEKDGVTMLPALISGVIGTLLQNNMPKVAQAVVDKGLDYVSDKLGVELKPDMTPQEVEAARQAAMKHEEFMVEQHVKNTADARDMQKVALQQDDKFSKRFVMYLTIFWSVAAVTYIGFVTFGTIPENNVRFADTILGFLLGTVVATMLNFWLGSSIGSKEKDIKK
jgi:uncharacterized membrane protein YqgA involved in biofilm formation